MFLIRTKTVLLMQWSCKELCVFWDWRKV